MNDRRTKPEIAGKLYANIPVERCNGQKPDHTPVSKRGQGRTLASGHPVLRRHWASEEEPLPAGTGPLPELTLAGTRVAVPPGFTGLTEMSGN